MKKYDVLDKPFDAEEKSLMEAFENGAFHEDPDDTTRLKEKLSVARNVTIHMQQEDIEGMKKKAAQAGIPYQTLINSVIHRYLNGGIILKDAI